MGPQSSSGTYEGDGLQETEEKEGEMWCLVLLLVDGEDVVTLGRESLRGSVLNSTSASASASRLLRRDDMTASSMSSWVMVSLIEVFS